MEDEPLSYHVCGQTIFQLGGVTVPLSFHQPILPSNSMTMPYKLSETLKAHTSDVRRLLF